MSDDSKIVAQSRKKIPQTLFLNSEGAELLFTTFLHNVESLVPLIMHAFTEQYCILFQYQCLQQAPKINCLP